MLPNKEFFRLYGPYLRRPVLWPEICRREFIEPTKRRLGLPVETAEERQQAKTEGACWCDERAVETGEGLRAIGLAPPENSVRSLFPEEFRFAKTQSEEAGVKLGGEGNLTLLYNLVHQLGAMHVVETGVAYGWSSLAILLSLQERPEGRLISVDLPYFALRNDDLVGRVVPGDLRSQWVLLRMADREGLPRALRKASPIDVCHYDSDKSRAGRRWSYRRIWQALRPGGVLLTDDAGDNLAFRDFAYEVGVEPVIVRDGTKYQGLLVKR